MNKIHIVDYMNDFPPHLQSSMLLSDAVEKLIKSDVTGLPVTDEHNAVIGFVSEKDCIGKLLTSSYYCGPEVTVDEVMQTEVMTISPHDSIVEIADRLDQENHKVFPVTDGGKLVGLFTRSHLLAALKENQQSCHQPH
jgi:CBS domain-containing protein